VCLCESWDIFGVQQFLYPYCRKNAILWRLHEQAGITPEVEDVWDYIATTSDDHARNHPNFVMDNQDLYWAIENQRLQLSRDWETDQDPWDRPRDVSIEMVHVRERRRKRNAVRRKVVANKGTGLSALVPLGSPIVSAPPGVPFGVNLGGMFDVRQPA
jgi:hypothetical protein